VTQPLAVASLSDRRSNGESYADQGRVCVSQEECSIAASWYGISTMVDCVCDCQS
jgi:hypothetical protein